ncbi:MAG: SURF1 family protein [Gammaproteobacteria bacterium]|nr:SURF1 family protein [Gammaproteobacteria bacterium]
MVVRIGSYEFRPGLWSSLIVLALLVLLLTLGFWQLDRAAQKRALLTAYGDRPADAPIQLTADFKADSRLGPEWRYRRAQVLGAYDAEHQFLLDNRVYQGRVGYQVLTPLRLAHTNVAVLVNRGWVPQGATRADLPPLPAPSDAALTVAGLIDFPPQKVFVLGEGEDRDPGWPKVLQQVRLDLHAQQLGVRLLPLVLLLAPEQPGGFVRDWTPVVIGPERHVGYAVQWFALAAALAILYTLANLKRVETAGQ